MKFSVLFEKLLVHEANDYKYRNSAPVRDEPFYNNQEEISSSSNEISTLLKEAESIAKTKRINTDKIKNYLISFCMAVSDHHEIHAEKITDLMFIGSNLSIKLKGIPMSGSAGHMGHEFDHIFSIDTSNTSRSIMSIKDDWDQQIKEYLNDIQSRFDNAAKKQKDLLKPQVDDY
jgi:hypothetical protein